MRPIPVHIVAGFLGVGKTTTLLQLLRSRKDQERIAIVVNDVGTAGFDEAVLGEALGPDRIIEIEGGCICCTAPAGFVDAVRRLLDGARPDRIVVEPTGIAMPADLRDTLARAPFADRLRWMPTIVLVDPTAAARGSGDPLRIPIVRDQIEAAEVLVAHRVDRASEADLEAFRALAARVWPPPLRVIEASFGALPDDVWDLDPVAPPPQGHRHDHDHDHGTVGVVHGLHVRTLTWADSVRFGREALVEALARCATDPDVVRIKGVFRTEDGVWLVEVAGARAYDRPSAFRGGSRVDVITRTAEGGVSAASAIEGARGVGPMSADGLEIVVVGPAGRRITLGPERLAALPAQIADVGSVVPNRVGVAVPLCEALAAAGVSLDGSVVAVAHDGLATRDVALSELRTGLLVYRLGDGPLPAAQGGPIRLLVPGDAGPAGPCSNVKGLARLVIRPAKEPA